MLFQKERIDHNLNRLLSKAKRIVFNLENMEYQPSDYKKNNTPPESGWLEYNSSVKFTGVDTHYWVKAKFKTPKAEEDKYFVLSAKCGREGRASILNPQSIIYLNGEMVHGFDTNHFETYLEPETEYEMFDYVYTGNSNDPIYCAGFTPVIEKKYAICEIDEEIEHLYYDMRVAYECCKLMPENSGNFMQMMATLQRAVDLFDFRLPAVGDFYEGVKKAQKIVTEEIYDKLCTTEGKPIVNCIGHTHIDLEWLWTRRQTREKMQRSFATAAELMKRYPEYKFMLSQPQLYIYLKEEAPEKYEELKRLVKEGRWEPEGAMFVEADCNLISGESFVRQLLHGKTFFNEEFGVDCKMLFLPDVFGYSAALPQILKKSGIRHFVTSKISWNDTNTMPLDMFMWQGIDGSEIFTNFITTQRYTGEHAQRYTVYGGTVSPAEIKGTWNRFQQKDYTNRSFSTFGHGDGGGGPTKEMLETYRRLAKGMPDLPVAEMGFLLPHLDRVKADFDEYCEKNKKTPRWVGELYLEKHRGTYTSMARNKRFNRQSENMLSKAEALSYISLMSGGAYDSKGLHDNWQLVLHNQFHDIIPGSSIREVYDNYTDKDYKNVLGYCDNIIKEKLSYITERLDTKGGSFVYNALGFPAKGPIMLNGKTAEAIEEIPAFGWKVNPEIATECAVLCKNLTVENKYYILELNKNGEIKRLYDKLAEREVFEEGKIGNELELFEDIPLNSDNWDIDGFYGRKVYSIKGDTEITPVTDGTRAGFRIVKRYSNSVIRQTVWLYSECRRIDIENDIDWNEHHQLLKAVFPFNVYATSATYEIQYGHVSRPTYYNTSWDQAKFEVYAHKWVDVADSGYGVALLNDCKYGYSAQGSTLKLTMLKCGTYPNEQADVGKHIFTYSLLPHIGDFRESGVINEAYILNQPLTAANVEAGRGSLPEGYSAVSCNKDNVIIETVKKAQADDGMIIRMYEAFNRRENIQITVAESFKKAYLCDLMENELEEIELNNNSLKLSVSNFEIITLKLVK